MTSKIVTIAEMRQLEAEANAGGVSYAAMMDRAGRAVAEAVLARVNPSQSSVVVLAGSGNNGGDGLAAAQYLARAGVAVKVYCLKPPDEADPKVAVLRELSVFIVDAQNDLRLRVLKQLMGGATILIDAVFGIGARLPVAGLPAQLLGAAQKAIAEKTPGPLVIAVDCPSGMNCDTGEIDPTTLAADVTVTFGAAKIGQVAATAVDVVGELVVADIGWPPDMPSLTAIGLEMATARWVRKVLPPRPRSAHKYQFGSALVVGGSSSYVGAAFLCGAAACRIGTGLVAMAVPQAIQSLLATRLAEAIWVTLPQTSTGSIAPSAADAVSAQLPRATAVVVGMGLGQEEATAEFIAALLPQLKQSPTVLLDADGLRLASRMPHWHTHLPAHTVLTPHIGEMAAMTGLDKNDIQRDRLAIAQRFAVRWGAVVLLKGAYSVVAAPDGRTMIEPFATAALAKAGSGDVLSGIVGGLMAQGVAAFEAAVAGAYLHGRAAQIAERRLGTSVSVVAGDIVAAIAQAVSEVTADH